MAGVKALRSIQMGVETTAGTEADATTIWRGTGAIEDEQEVTFPEEDVGYLSGLDRTYIAKLGGTLEFESVPATFEQVSYLLNMGIASGSTAADGSGSGVIWTHTAATTQGATFDTYTLEMGDNQQFEVLTYGMAEELAFEGKAGEALMMGATIRGQQPANTTKTASLSVPSVEDVLFSKGKLYIDAVGGTMGTTQVTNSWLSMSMTIDTGRRAVWTADGNLYFSFDKQVMPEIVTEVTFEHDSFAVAAKTDARAQEARQLRMEWEGTAFTTAGTAYTYKTFRMDQVAKVESFTAIEDEDGNDIITATFRARYNDTAAKFFEALVVNTLSDLP